MNKSKLGLIKAFLCISFFVIGIMGFTVPSSLQASYRVHHTTHHNSSHYKKLPSLVIGSKNAPVSIYAFVAMSCPHCEDEMSLLLGGVKKKYIDTGKVKLVIMSFPIGGKVGIYAHSLLYHTNSQHQLISLMKILFRNASSWIRSSDPQKVFAVYGELAGMSKSQIKLYLKDRYTPKIIRKNIKLYAKKYKLEGTPTSFITKSNLPINNRSAIKLVGFSSKSSVVNAINKVLRQK